WIDESAERRQRIVRGEILVAPVIAYGIQGVPNGIIHHWIGGIFIPGATIDSLSAIALDYSRYKDFYSPVVVESKLLACTATGQRFSMLWHRKVLFVDVAMQVEYAAHEVRIDSQRGYNVADTVQLQELEKFVDDVTSTDARCRDFHVRRRGFSRESEILRPEAMPGFIKLKSIKTAATKRTKERLYSDRSHHDVSFITPLGGRFASLLPL